MFLCSSYVGHCDRCAESYVTRDKIKTSLVLDSLFLTLIFKDWFLFLLFHFTLPLLSLHAAVTWDPSGWGKWNKHVTVAVAALSETLFQHGTEAAIWRTLLSFAASTSAPPVSHHLPVCIWPPGQRKQFTLNITKQKEGKDYPEEWWASRFLLRHGRTKCCSVITKRAAPGQEQAARGE